MELLPNWTVIQTETAFTFSISAVRITCATIRKKTNNALFFFLHFYFCLRCDHIIWNRWIHARCLLLKMAENLIQTWIWIFSCSWTTTKGRPTADSLAHHYKQDGDKHLPNGSPTIHSRFFTSNRVRFFNTFLVKKMKTGLLFKPIFYHYALGGCTNPIFIQLIL